MKIKNILIIFVVIILLVLFKFNLKDQYANKGNNVENIENSIELNTDFNTENASIDESKEINLISIYDNYENIIFIGDSRTVGLSNISNNDSKNIEFICEVGKGLGWIKNQNIENKIKNKENLILINLGINDLYNINKYIEYFSSLNINNNIYYISVLPVDEIKENEYGYNIKNYQVEEFNNKLKDNFNYIDIYSYMIDNGFETIDGIHYNKDTNFNIYNYLMQYIKEMNLK